jgi:integrase
MARLYKRPDRGNTYWYDFIDPRTGRRRRVNTGCTSKAEAEAFVQELWARLKGLIQDTETVYLSQAVQDFLAAKSRMMRSAWRYEIALQNVLAVMGDVPLQAIDRRWLMLFRDRRLQAGATPATVNREWTALSSLLSWAVERGLIDANPALRVRRLKEAPPRDVYFRPDEIRRLLETPTTPHMRMAFLLALTTGLRRGELLRLRREDVLDTGEIAIRNAKSGRDRYVPVPDPVLAELRRYMAAYRHDPYLFPWRGMERRSGKPTGFRTAWRSWLRRAGVRRLRFHDVRHTFAAYFVTQTGDLRALQAVLGHATPYMSLRYGHYVEEYRERIRRGIAESFASVLDFPQIGTKMAPKTPTADEEWLQ